MRKLDEVRADVEQIFEEIEQDPCLGLVAIGVGAGALIGAAVVIKNILQNN